MMFNVPVSAARRPTTARVSVEFARDPSEFPAEVRRCIPERPLRMVTCPAGLGNIAPRLAYAWHHCQDIALNGGEAFVQIVVNYTDGSCTITNQNVSHENNRDLIYALVEEVEANCVAEYSELSFPF